MIELTVNGEPRALDLDPEMPLLWVLRDHLGLRGTKYGCGVGLCGVCTVHVDGEANHACMVPLHKAAGRSVTTIEALAGGPPHPVLATWIAEQVPQCGYCQPGQIMRTAALLDACPPGDEAACVEQLSEVLCRCGTYARIRAALRRLCRGEPASEPAAVPPPAPDAGVAVGPWVRVHGDDSVTIAINHAEMGQGVSTSLAALLAEELGVAMEQVRIGFAPVAPEYRNPMFGEQSTGGSTSVRGEWERLRAAGASVRARLCAAAARRWKVPVAECGVCEAAVEHRPSARREGFAALAVEAAREAEPAHTALTPPARWRLLGRSLPRLDVPDMAAGRSVYGVDVRVPDLRFAVIARCPVFGGRLADYDDAAARAVPGVEQVLAVPSGVAVVAADTWSALRGREALALRWEAGPNAELDDGAIARVLDAALRGSGTAARADGDAEGVLAGAGSVLEASYSTSHLAHATLEPMNCTARVDRRRCEVWVGTQNPEGARDAAARVSGLAKERVQVHSVVLGGGFGRRYETDVVEEAVAVARAAGVPVQLLWSRQDDFRHDRYRPAHRARLRAALDDAGYPVAWWQRTAGPSIALDGIEIAYAIPNVREERVRVTSAVPDGAWRSVGPGQNAFVVESFVDELAQAGGHDPLAYRLALLAHAPRHRGVLERAAEVAGYGHPSVAGAAHGVAVYRGFGSWIAQVAEVSLQGPSIRVHRIVCAIDCGIAVNPDGVRAQVEGGIAMGLSAALKEELRIEAGRAVQDTYGDYPILTLREMPRVEVHVMASTEKPGGVGEPGVMPVAPAVANALFAASGWRLRSLPLRL